jgi:hypothetical protein
MTATAGVFDDAFGERPVGQVFVFAFFLGFDNVARKVTTDMFHALVPAPFTLEDSATEAASTSLWWSSLFDPASVPYLLKAVLECSPVLGISTVGWIIGRTRA